MYEDEYDIDPITGQLREKPKAPAQPFVISPLNRKLLYTKSEVDALVANAGGRATISDTEPSSGSNGQFYYNTQNSTLYIYISGVWTAISGGAPAGGTFSFIDGTGFDFVDGTYFDFIT